MVVSVYRIRNAALALLAGATLLAATCDHDPVYPPAGERLAVGTWGGENAGVIVDDTVAHVHIGCTLGSFPGPVRLDADGRFSVAGSYTLRAFPVHIGPAHPAQFSGSVANGRLTLTVAVNDTVEKKLVVLGPVVVTFGREPRMGPCPICRKPSELSMAASRLGDQARSLPSKNEASSDRNHPARLMDVVRKAVREIEPPNASRFADRR